MKKYIYNFKLELSIAIFFVFLGSIFSVIVQFLKGTVLDHALDQDKSKTLIFVLLLVTFILLEIGFHYFYDRLRASFSINCIKQLKKDLFNSIINRSYVDFIGNAKGEYISKYTNDIDMIQNLYFSTIPLLLEILIKIVLVSIALFILDWRLAIVTLLLLTTPLYIPKLIEKKLQRSKVEYADAVENHISKITDWLSGFEIIKNFSIEARILKCYSLSNEITMRKALKNKILNYSTSLISTLISYLSYFIILVIATIFVISGNFTAGDFFIAIGMIDQLSYPLIALSEFIQDLVSIKPICDNITEFINHYDMPTPESTSTISELSDCIKFSNVSFAYDNDKQLLHNFTLKVEKNKRYLIRGKSGSGKTTLINLLLKYYIPKEGDILIDGKSISVHNNLYNLITIVRQDAFLFADTLRNNLSMYTDYTDDILINILKKVNLVKYANKESLDMLITEGGVNLSGGEKKRVCIARALLRNTNVLIFDEPLANLDENNMTIIEKVLLDIRDKTLIIVSHQFSDNNLRSLDKVITVG